MRGLIALLILAAHLSGCARNRVTGELDHNYFSEASDIELGQEVQRQAICALREQGVEVDTDSIELIRLRRILDRIVAVSEYADEFPWEVHLAEAPLVNAWCAPGGKIMVFRGLLDRERGLARTDDELAGVLAHEVAHATCRHVSRARSAQLTTRAVLLVPYLVLSLFVPGAQGLFSVVTSGGVSIYMPAYSRSNEREADRVGLIYMAKAGYDPRVMVALWERAAADDHAGVVSTLFASHPGGGERADRLREAMDEAMAHYREALAAP